MGHALDGSLGFNEAALLQALLAMGSFEKPISFQRIGIADYEKQRNRLAPGTENSHGLITLIILACFGGGVSSRGQGGYQSWGATR
jgi:hypothetical protein